MPTEPVIGAPNSGNSAGVTLAPFSGISSRTVGGHIGTAHSMTMTPSLSMEFGSAPCSENVETVSVSAEATSGLSKRFGLGPCFVFSVQGGVRARIPVQEVVQRRACLRLARSGGPRVAVIRYCGLAFHCVYTGDTYHGIMVYYAPYCVSSTVYGTCLRLVPGNYVLTACRCLDVIRVLTSRVRGTAYVY